MQLCTLLPRPEQRHEPPRDDPLRQEAVPLTPKHHYLAASFIL